jgi:hypothetical protein
MDWRPGEPLGILGTDSDLGVRVLRELRVVVPLLLLTASACSRNRAGDAAPADGSARVEVQVTNQNALPMDIVATGSGITHRLGTVHPGMDGKFLVPQTMVGSGAVVFEVRPSGGGRPFRSGEILLAPGALIEIDIAPQLFNSTANRRD